MTIVADSAPSAEIFCPSCGYDLRAITSDRCPECGLAVDRSGAGMSQLPWAHRVRIGRVRAYLATVLRVTFRTRKLPEELNRPVGYRDAQWFRAITIVLAALTPLTLVFIAMANGEWMDADDVRIPILGGPFHDADYAPEIDFGLPWVVGMSMYPVYPTAIVLAFVLITGAGSYFFAPRSLDVVRQNRAIALSYYASGPLGLLPVAGIILALMLGADVALRDADGIHDKVMIALALILAAVVFVIAYGVGAVTFKLLRAVHGGSWLRAVGVNFLVFLTGVLSLGLAFFVFPWCVGFVAVVVDSWR